MGKHKQANESVEDHQPGCIFGFGYILDFQHWHFAKKLLPYKWTRTKEHRQTNCNDWDSDDGERNLADAEAEEVLDKRKASKTKPNKGKTGKSRIKALVAEEMSREEDLKDQISDIQLKKAHESPYAFTHNNNKKHDARESTNHLDSWENKVDQKPNNARETAGKNYVGLNANRLADNAHRDYSKERADVVDIFKVNRQLLQQYLQTPDSSNEAQFRRPQSSTKKIRLTKSGSFPMAKSLSGRECRSTSLEHKQKETWIFQRVPYVREVSKYEEDRFCKQEDTEIQLRRASSINEPLDQYTQLFARTFKKDPKLPHSKSLRLANEEAPKMFRRILSLHAFDFNQPLQNDVSAESGFEIPSKTTVNSSDKVQVGAPILTEKSAPLYTVVELDSPKEVVEGNACATGACPSGITVMINETTGRRSHEVHDHMVDSEVRGDNSEKAHDAGSISGASTELVEGDAVSGQDYCFHEDIITPGAPHSEASLGSESSFCDSHEQAGLESISIRDSTEVWCTTLDNEYAEVVEKSGADHSIHDDPDLDYVRLVLETSGFTGNEFFESWHSSDQPLSPWMFAEVEDCLLHEPESKGAAVGGNRNRKLVFDLINDGLLEIGERSSPCWPRALSFSCHVHAVPVGHFLVEEVYKSTSCDLGLRPNLEQSFDSVAEHLAKGHGWMNLQFETESVGLELEDLIFDELLEETLGF